MNGCVGDESGGCVGCVVDEIDVCGGGLCVEWWDGEVCVDGGRRDA